MCPRLPGKKAEVMFTMSEGQVKCEVPGQPAVVGKDHQFILTGVGNQNLMVYSRQPTGKEILAASVIIQRHATRLGTTNADKINI